MRKLISAAMVIQKSMLAWRSGNVADNGGAPGLKSSRQLATTATSSSTRSSSAPVQKRILRHHRKATQPTLSPVGQSELNSTFLANSPDVRGLFSRRQRHDLTASVASGAPRRAITTSDALPDGGLSSECNQRHTSSPSPLLSPRDFDGMDLFPDDLDGLGEQDLEQSTSPLGSSSLGGFAPVAHHSHHDHDGAVTEDDDQFHLSGFSEDGEE